MESYFIPSSVSLNNSVSAENSRGDATPILYRRKRSSGETSQESGLYPMTEHERGTPAGLPSYLRRPRAHHQDQDAPVYRADDDFAEPEPGRYPFLAKYEQPMEIRRRIPGSGINHYDSFDSPVRAKRSPIQPKAPIFNQGEVEDLLERFDKDPSVEALFGKQKFVQEHFQRKTYGRHIARRQLVPKIGRPGAALILSSSEKAVSSTQSQQRQVCDTRYPFPSLSPLSSSSSSSSDDSPQSSIGSYSRFEPLDASSFNRTPLQRRNSQMYKRHPTETVYSTPDTLSAASSGSSVSEEFIEVYLPESPIPRETTSLLPERPAPHTW